jgi:hypothetical protein
VCRAMTHVPRREQISECRVSGGEYSGEWASSAVPSKRCSSRGSLVKGVLYATVLWCAAHLSSTAAQCMLIPPQAPTFPSTIFWKTHLANTPGHRPFFPFLPLSFSAPLLALPSRPFFAFRKQISSPFRRTMFASKRLSKVSGSEGHRVSAHVPRILLDLQADKAHC